MQQEIKIIPDVKTHQAIKNYSETIISDRMPERQSMPLILAEIMDILNDLFPNANYNCKLNILLAKTGQMISFKRVCFQEIENIKLINHYAINFMPSGMGKDKICNDLDRFIFKNFILYFKDKAKDYIAERELQIEQEASNLYPEEKQQGQKDSYIQTQIQQIRMLDLEVGKATPEGLFEDAKAFNLADFGSIFVKLSEFGLFLQNGRQEDLLFFTSLFDAYDGKISSKSTKYSKRESSIDNMPVNTLLHSDYTMFKTDIQSHFNLLMQMGLARRSITSFQHNNIQKIETNPKIAREKQEKAYLKANIISDKLINSFMNIPDKAVYKLTNDAYDDVFYPYCVEIAELCNEHKDNEIFNKEIKSRELKVLKIAGMFACLNHPTELIINKIDVNQAIVTVEQLSKDLKKFIDYKPKVNDSYELLFNFLTANLNETFSKTMLINKYRDFGFKREVFRKDFENILEIVAEMATQEGYFLQQEPINNNSGVGISLVKKNLNTPLPADIKELNEII